ncbi:hypothetical protein PC9H_002669 [Pleurotus ostreatus]|uniref:G domain-containing protein n=1 Tax=Pleurotus ostreatus TaxID=5322 RepID=A0A8H6ZL56_PLEOS|nr:uncharacterized protein PC9H_002669 [Pleurotus ostreatus]KAF7416403.1 hypothetical protein PC9H_002669 [Pleurotus ostreatus]KAJ8689313.1 hypothetical protein PTI98_013346 [Pleurotus ostreatus]
MLWFHSSNSEQTYVILILGLAGDGKSSFINAATGKQQAATSKSLQPCTTAVKDFVCKRSGSKFVFIDTPGLDLDEGKDVDASVGRILARYKRSYVDAIIYLHHSTRKVITRPPEPSSVVTKFQTLCGPAWRSRTILAVMGDTADTVRLEGALQAIYFSGIKVAPFTINVQGGGDAWNVLDQVITVK